ncbi:MAG: DUF2073 domain-containing protein [Candidatus Altiarchaeota archaeon]
MDIELEFVSADILRAMTIYEKINYILEHVKEDKIIVIEESMSPNEETALIEATMKEISKKFPGIEVSTLRERGAEGMRERLIRILGGSTGGLTVIGPSKLIKNVSKRPDQISMLAGGDDKRRKGKK